MAGTTTQTKKPATDKVAKKQSAFRIHARRPHRRAGFDFGKQPVEIPKADLSKEQIALLEGDTELVIEEAEV